MMGTTSKGPEPPAVAGGAVGFPILGLRPSWPGLRWNVRFRYPMVPALRTSALVIRAHLYVESALIQLIEAAMVNKEALDVARLRFETKVEFAAALGKLDTADLPAIVALNKLRNRLAHNITTQLCEQDEVNLHNTLSPQQRKIADHIRKPELSFLVKLRCDLTGIMLSFHQAV